MSRIRNIPLATETGFHVRDKLGNGNSSSGGSSINNNSNGPLPIGSLADKLLGTSLGTSPSPTFYTLAEDAEDLTELKEEDIWGDNSGLRINRRELPSDSRKLESRRHPHTAVVTIPGFQANNNNNFSSSINNNSSGSVNNNHHRSHHRGSVSGISIGRDKGSVDLASRFLGNGHNSFEEPAPVPAAPVHSHYQHRHSFKELAPQPPVQVVGSGSRGSNTAATGFGGPSSFKSQGPRLWSGVTSDTDGKPPGGSLSMAFGGPEAAPRGTRFQAPPPPPTEGFISSSSRAGGLFEAADDGFVVGSVAASGSGFSSFAGGNYGGFGGGRRSGTRVGSTSTAGASTETAVEAAYGAAIPIGGLSSALAAGAAKQGAQPSRNGPPVKSAPVNVPDWSKILKQEYKKPPVPYDASDDESDDIAVHRLPPHVIVERDAIRNQRTTFSMCEGIGGTLKGVDAIRKRNDVLRRTGFLDGLV